MNPDQVKAAIESLKNGDGAAALEVLEALLVSLATGANPDASGDAGGAPPAASGAGATSGNADESKDPNKAEKPDPAMNALARGVVELFGGDAGSALVAVRALKAEADKRASDAAVLEAVERRGLVADLVKLEVEVPATAWVDPEKTGAELAPVERLAKEPIAELRKRVSLIKSTRGVRSARTAPAQETLAPAKRALTKAEQAYCKRHGISAEEFEARKASAARRSK